MTKKKKKAVIIGAGPAGLTAAAELIEKTNYNPLVLESTSALGGISQTINYKGNRMDIGGHRFFSKSDRVMSFWLERMPLEKSDPDGKTPDAELEDRVMLIRSRLSRIYFLRRFFTYPITLDLQTLKNLGMERIAKIGSSYIKAACLPKKEPQNLEEFFINRFGGELYRTFFKSYTEKVWGVSCKEISAEWGAQRIKGLTIRKAIEHQIKKHFHRRPRDIAQKEIETTLIEQFIYPKYGPGQMWEMVAEEICSKGGLIRTQKEVVKIWIEDNRIKGVETIDRKTGIKETFTGDLFFSTMPVKELVRSLATNVPKEVLEVSEGLLYRDFITVGLLVKEMKNCDYHETKEKCIRDNWVYIQEPDVLLGRLQIFNNWSPYLVKNSENVWLGLEYFCSEGDELWSRTDNEIIDLAKKELASIEIIEATDVLDATVIRMKKTYPAYFGSYNKFSVVQRYLEYFENLYLIGRNGMHRYNNQDHSMLTAMTAVDNVVSGRTDKSNIWAVNAEQEYHEEKSTSGDY